eukprot:1874494-Prymnesium_polylepis.2
MAARARGVWAAPLKAVELNRPFTAYTSPDPGHSRPLTCVRSVACSPCAPHARSGGYRTVRTIG